MTGVATPAWPAVRQGATVPTTAIGIEGLSDPFEPDTTESPATGVALKRA